MSPWKVFSAGMALLASACTYAQDAALQQRIDAMIREPQVARAHWGIHVTRLDGTALVAIDEGQLFQPASNNKMFTTAAAMALLDTDAQRSTTITSDAVVDKHGVLHGALTLHGAADANFSARTLPYQPKSQRPTGPQPPQNDLRYVEELADKLKAAGITRVDGDVVGDDTLFPWDPYANGWSIADATWYYGAPINALMIGDNAINLKISPGLKPGDDAVVQLNPALPYYTVENHVTTVAKGAEAHTDIQRSVLVSGGSRTLRLYGSIAVGDNPESEDVAMEDPAEYAAIALKAALEQRGVRVLGKPVAKHRIVPTYTFTHDVMEPLVLQGPKREMPSVSLADGEKVLAVHEGNPLYDDVVVTNKVSQNQHAELFLRDLALTYGKDGTLAQGARVIRSFLTTKVGIDGEDFIFFDGSGLSGDDLVAPRATTQLLRYAASQPWGAKWKASLPIGGEDGSLAGRFSQAPLKDHVFAKTGTLSETRALSGYLDCASGQTVVFSIMVNAHTPRTHDDMKTMDAIVRAIQAAE